MCVWHVTHTTSTCSAPRRLLLVAGSKRALLAERHEHVPVDIGGAAAAAARPRPLPPRPLPRLPRAAAPPRPRPRPAGARSALLLLVGAPRSPSTSHRRSASCSSRRRVKRGTFHWSTACGSARASSPHVVRPVVCAMWAATFSPMPLKSTSLELSSASGVSSHTASVAAIALLAALLPPPPPPLGLLRRFSGRGSPSSSRSLSSPSSSSTAPLTSRLRVLVEPLELRRALAEVGLDLVVLQHLRAREARFGQDDAEVWVIWEVSK